jgi:hypothetical protein
MFNGAPGEAETTEKSACGLTLAVSAKLEEMWGSVIEVGCRDEGQWRVGCTFVGVVTLNRCNE